MGIQLGVEHVMVGNGYQLDVEHVMVGIQDIRHD